MAITEEVVYVRQSFHLEREQVRRLEQLARERKLPKSILIRQAVDSFLSTDSTPGSTGNTGR